MPLYEVAMIQHPSKEDAEKGVLEKLILAPIAVVARDGQAAAIKVAMNPDHIVNCNQDQLEVIVRPFVEE